MFIIGEEVANYHGAYKITKGLIDKWGSTRLYDTPITESGFTGLAVGSALLGLTPVVEFMTMNFSLQAMDHIINSAGKLHYMSGGELSSGIVFRGLNGPAAAVAAQHSQCFAALYSNIPGIITLSPYDCNDCLGMLRAAIRAKEVVVFLENENMYSDYFEVSGEALDPNYVIPIGKAKIMREGKHVTLVGYSRNVKFCLEAAEELAKEGIECEVLNLRSIKPLDRDAIV